MPQKTGPVEKGQQIEKRRLNYCLQQTGHSSVLNINRLLIAIAMHHVANNVVQFFL